MVLSRLTKITGPGVSTDTNWVGNNADFTGITTSGTSFNIGVTTIHSNLIEAHNIKSTGILTATGGSFSGNVTAVDGTFSGNVSIAGTLTYEDVTNIDSVGIITAPALDVDDFLDVGSNIKLGNAGVITATSFVGSGAALTGIDATAIKDSGGNVKIQAQASGAIHTGVSTFQDLTVEKSGNLNVNIKSTSGWGALEVGGATAGYIDIKKPFSADFDLRLMHDGSNSYITSPDKPFSLYALGHRGILIDALGQTDLRYRDNVKLKTETGGISVTGVLTATSFVGDGSNLTGITQTTINNNADNRVITGTGSANTLNAESNVHVDGSGRLLVGTSTNNAHANADNAVISGTGNIGLSIMSTDSGRSSIYFGDSSSSPGSYAGFIDFIHSNNSFNIGRGNDNSLTIDASGRLGVGVNTPTEIFHIKKNDTTGPTITLENNANKGYINNWGSAGGGSGRTNRFEINATSQAQASICAPYITFMTGGVGDSYEKVRITGNGDLKVAASTALSSPSTGYKRIVIGNNLILNAGSSAGGYTGFQNNAYVNSSGNWVRVNNDYASSIGMDDGNIYFRNVGAGTGNISWSMPLQIYANGTSTFGSTVTVNGHILSQGTSGRGGIFGQIQVGYSTLYNSIQNSVANTPIHLQYNNTGDVKCNEGGGDLRTADIIPHTNNSSNLGSSTRRWANIHTNDLNLSNEGSANDVDGTWGQYTIQEGQDNLFLINRRNGKRYKFLLQEID